ncbi:MAG: hypothetical protein ACRCTA_05755, partial [Bacilli bacterium]
QQAILFVIACGASSFELYEFVLSIAIDLEDIDVKGCHNTKLFKIREYLNNIASKNKIGNKRSKARC